MTALSITTSQVNYLSGPMELARAGEAITVGMGVYLAADGAWYKAQCDGTALEAGSQGLGIALASALAAGQYIGVAKPGAKITLGAGAGPTAGVVYYVGATAGAINPVADLTSTNKVTPICQGIGSNQVKVLRDYDAGAVL